MSGSVQMNYSQSLAGDWRFCLDEEQQGVALEFYNRRLTDTIRLPGTTAERCKGSYHAEGVVAHLSEAYPYRGYAWYQREIEVSPAIAGKPLQLLLERTRISHVWIDGVAQGSQNSLSAPHLYSLGKLQAGKYTLTVLVDNASLPIPGGHLTSPDTQTNWNGLLGRLELQAMELVRIAHMEIHPDPAHNRAVLKLEWVNDRQAAVEATIEVAAIGQGQVEASPAQVSVHNLQIESGASRVEFVYLFDGEAQTWDAWDPHLYRLQVDVLVTGEAEQFPLRQRYEQVFGMRDFRPAGTQFAINGRKVLLRGKHDALVFPETGYAPMNVEAWIKVLTIAKSYGINHYRFHTCCPPEAAFAAADIVGIYFEPELPFWGAIEAPEDDAYDPVKSAYLREEGLRILKAYGNHPSFVLFTLGNELHGSRQAMSELVDLYRTRDGGRRLYAEGANNYFWAPSLSEASDFWVTMRTGQGTVRGSFSHADLPLGHIQALPPSTMIDYSDNLAGIDVPVISHEIGQYQSYPDFKEIERYTGVLKPRNLEIFRQRLAEKGMLVQAEDFLQASGQLAVLGYREEMEAAMRTPGFGGFQLLDLQDFPGQGTALVGILNAFMESKGFIAPEAWREFCSDTVLLARFPKYTYTSDETFTADLELAHYGPEDVEQMQAEWQLWQGGRLIGHGETAPVTVRQGSVTRLGTIQAALSAIGADACQLQLTLAWKGTDIRNRYPIWVYPRTLDIQPHAHVHLTRKLDEETVSILEAGGRVLLIPAWEGNEVGLPGFFMTDFWCYPMFRSICENNGKMPAPGTLGLLCDEKHPALRHFPTEFHSNWQWWFIAMHARSLILDELPASLRPIVQVIDNFERNHKLAMLFEAQIGQGGLLVCASDLLAQSDKPEARQLLYSLLQYAASTDFQPAEALSLEQLSDAIEPRGHRKSHRDTAVVNPSYN